MKLKKNKRNVCSITKSIPPIYFIKAYATECFESPLAEPLLEFNKELINYFQDLFVKDDMVELEEDTSNRDVPFIGHDIDLNNREATSLPGKNKS